ncbi:MAG: peptidoglycan binding protein CsiV [Candidatus Thiodiazotropha lotti]|uniref:Peptidoglycan-binding protein CsiV n=1 Tax=Candidatus Thiodiazotropha endoloripes TaxID=1818881 RepID=A0A1E2USG1_9GAMM|nr:CsiV family protein [Candidatus Thiodiazotropha endoloripes]MCG7898041.1 peptidoglycan binding protein CsiV [Candidatus Thiodiazotropha weberae]MCG7990519.1 peptidoglycan binding protein CsiV [Candidatus Thiodiazotropha lotti]MCG7999896.1 peptidoglycan binding protein CsiV [Candidatus Thiodiazotropha lotti]MCW4182173.1 peptidoglycan binding protein CsiV [Candidatus Thiodiazotropha weberae]MCW4191665.1 peptidoglycan binding protein CsiV [Candidatus Thiodiazotropha weberae]
MLRKMIVKQEKVIILILSLLLIAPMNLYAESHEEQESAPWYQFEVLVFRRIAPGAGSTEGWALDPGIPDQEQSLQLSPGPLTEDGQPIAYRALPAEEKSLTEAWGAMRRSRDYRPLYHTAWRQPVAHPDQAIPIHISLASKRKSAFEEPLPILEGNIKFGIKRYLHLETDLLLRVEEDQTLNEAEYDPGPQNYRMQEKRRMRSGKLHYLDHPVLGILAIATRYEMPAPPEEPEPEAELIETTPEPSTESQQPETKVPNTQ